MGEETTRSLSDATIYVDGVPFKCLGTIELIADTHSNALMCVVCGLRIGKKMRWRNALLAADRMRHSEKLFRRRKND